jgi:hypothetical protein
LATIETTTPNQSNCATSDFDDTHNLSLATKRGSREKKEKEAETPNSIKRTASNSVRRNHPHHNS